ncbi:MAG: lysylphosphatidylglycerol synthase transmembrane domain-containing protein [Halolamina sp.]
MTRARLLEGVRSVGALRRAAGFLAGLALGATALWVVGPTAVTDALAAAQTEYVMLAAGLVAVALTLWGVSLWVVLRSSGTVVGVGRACWLFLGSVFLNSVTPFGQVGGDLPSGYLLARDRGLPSEAGVAAIAGVNTVNKLAGIALGVVGTLAVGALGSLATVRGAVVWSLVAVATVGVAAVAWRHRRELVDGLTVLLAPPLRRLTAVVPRVEPTTGRGVRSRLDGFVRTLERIGTPRTVAVVVLLGGAGQLAVSATLWAALRALGAAVPMAAALVAIPVARLAGTTPTPGGLGGVEVALVGVLVAVTGVGTIQAGAAAVLYRAVSFWLPLLPGGVAVGTVFVGSAD